jgi:hypothetical protein
VFWKWILLWPGWNFACKEHKTTGIRAPRKRLVAAESIHSSVRDKNASDRALTDRRPGATLPFRHALQLGTAGVPAGVVLSDAGYGNDTDFRRGISASDSTPLALLNLHPPEHRAHQSCLGMVVLC